MQFDKKVNQANKIEAYYLKLIGVTLLMTAASVSDAGNKRFYADDNVREIILEQFHLLSTSHWSEVVDWENAIKDASELPHQENALNDYTNYEVVVSNQSLPVFSAGSGLFYAQLNVEPTFVFHQPLFKQEPHQTSTERNKHSLITRAGPLA